MSGIPVWRALWSTPQPFTFRNNVRQNHRRPGIATGMRSDAFGPRPPQSIRRSAPHPVDFFHIGSYRFFAGALDLRRSTCRSHGDNIPGGRLPAAAGLAGGCNRFSVSASAGPHPLEAAIKKCAYVLMDGPKRHRQHGHWLPATQQGIQQRPPLRARSHPGSRSVPRPGARGGCRLFPDGAPLPPVSSSGAHAVFAPLPTRETLWQLACPLLYEVEKTAIRQPRFQVDHREVDPFPTEEPKSWERPKVRM